jgi:hypothetical protein
VFFLDTSGSTWAYRDRFFGLVRTLPVGEFAIELCSFDTEVYELDIRKPQVRGGGGTCFDALERWLITRRRARAQRKRAEMYPDVVFVLTDGDGGAVKPLHPERWHWLLTTDNARSVPAESVAYRLAEFA